MVELGRIENVNIREVWPNETSDFTPWLADNLDLLGEELGLVLELDRIEAPVGNFSLDILAREINRNTVVAIENQIAATDHVHLGQLMTYAAGYSAGIVIWVAADFRDEHRAALDWLNESTQESLDFYGVEISAGKIGGSLTAPIFRRAVVPNSWSKIKPTSSNLDDLTPTQKRYVQFWKPLLEELKNTYGWNIGTDNKISEYFAGSGFGNIARRMRLAWGGEARVELVIQSPSKDWNKRVFDLLKESQGQLESDMGIVMNWERRDDINSCYITVSRNGSIDDSEEEHDEVRAWMIENVRRFGNPSFHPYLENVLSRMEGES